MASLSKTKSGKYFVEFCRPDGSRPRLWLGAIPKRAAEMVKGHVEHLIASRRFSTPLPDSVSEWLAVCPDEVKVKLCEVGLLDYAAPTLLGEAFDTFVESLAKRCKPATVAMWRYVGKNIFTHFGKDRARAEAPHACCLRVAW